MILKKIDDKSKELSTLKSLLSQSNSDAQKKLISQNIKAVENGYKAEKDNAYYLDFAFGDRERSILLHDIRLEHNGKTAQFDHILVSGIGITVLESKSSTGILTINKDTSLTIKHGKSIKTLPSPVEQNNRHRVVLKSFIKDKIDLSARFKLMGGVRIDSKVLIHPKTTVSNKILPEEFERSDSFATRRDKEIESMGGAKVLLAAPTILTIENMKEIAQALLDAHTPIIFDYRRRYGIGKADNSSKSKKASSPESADDRIEDNSAEKEGVSKGEADCPRCKEGVLVKRKRKSKKYSDKYQSDEFYGCSRFPKCKYTQEI